MSNSEKISVSADEVEVINTSKNPEKIKITKIKADEDTSEKFGHNKNPFESFEKDNPMAKIFGNIEEIKKMKPYFFLALLFGFIALFGFRIYMAPLAIFFGILDLSIGSKLTKNASYIGIIFALIGLALQYG